MEHKKIVYELQNKAIRPACFHYAPIGKSEVFSTEFQHKEAFDHDLAFEVKALNREVVLSDLHCMDVTKSVLLYIYIYCDADKDVVFHFRANTAVKFWINNRLSSMDVNYYNYAFTDKLNRGENLIAIEMHPTKTECPLFTFRFHDVTADQSEPLASITNHNATRVKTRVRIISSQLIDMDSRPVKLIAVLDDKVHIDPEQIVKVELLDRDEKIIHQYNSRFNRVSLINTNCLLQKDQYNELIIRVSYNRNGKIEHCDEVLITGDLDRTIAAAIQKAEAALTRSDFPEEGRPGVTPMLKELENYQRNRSNPFYYFNQTRCLSAMLDAVNSSRSFDEYFFSPGFKTAYFTSVLDGREEHFHVLIPEGYRQNPKKTYPLLVYISVDTYTEHCRELLNYNTHGMIVADISPKGVTQGSYIGEAAILEALSQIKKMFAIDEERIYLMGFSNGATSAWILAQNYPQLFAGIVPLSGAPAADKIENLYNVPILSYISELSHSYPHYRTMEDKLAALPNFKQVAVDKFLHQDFWLIMNQLNAIDYIAQYSLNKYPRKIICSTREARHNKAYWVTIDKLAEGKSTSKIICEVMEQTIWADEQKIDAFTITLPPCVDKADFHIIINRTAEFAFTDYRKSTVSFQKTDCQWKLSSETAWFSCKGLGLPDIFLDAVDIYVSDINDAGLLKAAGAFSQPKTNGFNPNINIAYPIKSTNSLSAENEKSAIIIDNNADSIVLNEIRHQLPVKMDHTGYSYKGIFYEGNYCIMQIMSNPSTGKHLLHINCNDTGLLAQNLFTRAIILPSYANGLHPYLNNEALIYTGKKYYGIYEWGMNLEEIS